MTELVAAPHAADWALSRGISAMSTEELAEVIGVPPQQVRQRLQVPSRRGEWVAPGRGLWLPVPPEYRTWGAPPGIEVIQHLAAHLEVDYYVGWLSAAELLGAAHQAPQVFQVAVARQIPDRQVGRTLFQFHHRTRVGLVPTVDHVTRSGAALVSTVAVTTLDVATDVAVVGGIDNAATVLVELSEHPAFDLGAVIALAHHYPCLLYTSDAADERSSVDLGGRRIIKKKHSGLTTTTWKYLSRRVDERAIERAHHTLIGMKFT